MSFLDNLNWRYATKEFDTKKGVLKKDLEKILYSIKMAPTSMGLQAFKVLVISDQKIKNKLKPITNNQNQTNTCTYLLVFCSNTDLQSRIDSYVDAIRKAGGSNEEKLIALKKSRETFAAKKSSQELIDWSTKQVYITLGFAMAACAELKIDSCPMEGFNKSKMDKELNLTNNLKSQVLLPIGYRLKNPKKEKFRFPDDQLFEYL